MPSLTNRPPPELSLLPAALAILAVLTLLAGCGRKPWLQPLPREQYLSAMAVVEEMQERQRARSDCIDADVDIFLTSTVTDRAVSGYLQLFQPQAIKFVTSNPLGQPLFIVVSDGKRVQFVDTLQRYFGEGEPSQFGKTFDLPPLAVSGDWGSWLTARFPQQKELVGIRDDGGNRGFWAEFAARTAGTGEAQRQREQLLIDPVTHRIIAREILHGNGTTAATITYNQTVAETATGEAVQPAEIIIEGLDYSGRVVLNFSQLQAMTGCRQSDFNLTPPPGYRYQYLSSE